MLSPRLGFRIAGRQNRLRDGIPIAQTLSDKIRAVCERCGVPFVLEPIGLSGALANAPGVIPGAD